MMKHLLVYDTSTHEIVMRFVVTDCTRPWCVSPSKWVEFETEAEMRDYIAEHNLVEVSDETTPN